jgi:hypothetical protein
MKVQELIEKRIKTETIQFLECYNCKHTYIVTDITSKELARRGWTQFRGVLVCPSCTNYYKRNS